MTEDAIYALGAYVLLAFGVTLIYFISVKVWANREKEYERKVQRKSRLQDWLSRWNRN